MIHLAMFCISFGAALLLYIGCHVSSVLFCRPPMSSSSSFNRACALLSFVQPRCVKL
jgi:hypothetical protein